MTLDLDGHDADVVEVPFRPAGRVQADNGCAVCRGGGAIPFHEASPRCESGGRNHCSCDRCF